MSFSYAGVTLTPVKTNSWKQRAVFSDDGLQFHHIAHEIDVECLYNPKATASAPGALPPETNASIRLALMQPRGLLQWDLGGHTFLSSPRPGQVCDAQGGPYPVDCVVTQVSGVRTWHVRFVIRTYLSDCPDGERPIILSNQYATSHAIDEQHLTTITHRGRAVFDLAELSAYGQPADYFRTYLFPPVPPNFKPVHTDVRVSSDLRTIDWTRLDREQMVNLGDTQASASYITRAEMDFTTVNALPPAGDGGTSAVPVEIVNVKLWGDRRASEWVMMQRAFALASNKLPVEELGPGVGAIQQISWHQVLTDRFVHLQIIMRVFPQAESRFLGIRVDDLRKDPSAVFDDFDGDNPSLPWGKGTRGTYPGVITLQGLQQACLAAQEPDPEFGDDHEGGSVQVGPPPTLAVEAVDELPPFESSVRPDPNPYTDYDVQISRKRKEGVLMVPNATGPQKGHTDDRGNWVPDTPGPSASFFRIHQPVVTLDVAFTAERLNQPPVVPSPNSVDANLVLLDSEIIPAAPKLMADGLTPVYRVTGFIKWGCKRAPGATADFFVGILPWTALGEDEALLASEDFVTGIVDREDGTAPDGGQVGAAV